MLPIVMVIAAAVAGSGWYATRPEWTPVVTALRGKTQAFAAMLEQEWQASGAGPTQSAQAAGEVAQPQVERHEDAPKPEQNVQSALKRDQEAARSSADRNYERAMALLHQGRSSAAVHLLRQLAHGGHSAAAKTLGDLYSRGEDVLLDVHEAAHFYAIAARHGGEIER